MGRSEKREDEKGKGKKVERAERGHPMVLAYTR